MEQAMVKVWESSGQVGWHSEEDAAVLKCNSVCSLGYSDCVG